MACLGPVLFRTGVAPCFRCESCRAGRKAELVSRLVIEGLAHERVSMITLTYADPFLPLNGSLRPADMQAFLKRMREVFWRELRQHLRFFWVGEYGGRFGRPHYHVICFGADLSSVVGGLTLSSLARRSWRLGSIHVGGSWSLKTAAYVSGYVAKGHNIRGLDVLGDRLPELSRWPRRPGLGVPGLAALLPSLVGPGGATDWVNRYGDLPSRFVLDGSDRPLGSFLLNKLRSAVGMSDDEIRRLKRLPLEVEARIARHAHRADELSRFAGSSLDEVLAAIF